MNKKALSIIIISIIVFTGLMIGLNLFLEQKRKNDLLEQSQEFVSVWGNFTDEASDEYLAKIKPYVSEEIYTDYAEAAAELKANYEQGYKPNVSKFTTTSGPDIKKDGDVYIVTLKGDRSYVDYKNYQQDVSLTWGKEGKDYVITEIEGSE